MGPGPISGTYNGVAVLPIDASDQSLLVSWRDRLAAPLPERGDAWTLSMQTRRPGPLIHSRNRTAADWTVSEDACPAP